MCIVHGSLYKVLLIARHFFHNLILLGACIEDKLFPKTNSLHDTGRAQPLADIEEFSLKIKVLVVRCV